MSKNGKRITRDMRIILLDIRNKLKDMRNMIEETQDCHLSDIRNLRESIEKIESMFDLASPTKRGWYYVDYVLAEDVIEGESDEQDS